VADLTACPNNLNEKKYEYRAIIETPRQRRNKFDYDPDSNLFKLGGASRRDDVPFRLRLPAFHDGRGWRSAGCDGVNG